MNDTELQTDEEALRLQGMTDGAKSIPSLGLTMRPMTALSLSWMQRNRIFDDDSSDMMQKTASFAYLHSEDKDTIRGVVNDRAKFMDAIDQWIDNKISHHSQLEPFATEMNSAFEAYMSAQSNGGGTYQGDGSKN